MHLCAGLCVVAALLLPQARAGCKYTNAQWLTHDPHHLSAPTLYPTFFGVNEQDQVWISATWNISLVDKYPQCMDKIQLVVQRHTAGMKRLTALLCDLTDTSAMNCTGSLSRKEFCDQDLHVWIRVTNNDYKDGLQPIGAPSMTVISKLPCDHDSLSGQVEALGTFAASQSCEAVQPKWLGQPRTDIPRGSRGRRVVTMTWANSLIDNVECADEVEVRYSEVRSSSYHRETASIRHHSKPDYQYSLELDVSLCKDYVFVMKVQKNRPFFVAQQEGQFSSRCDNPKAGPSLGFSDTESTGRKFSSSSRGPSQAENDAAEDESDKQSSSPPNSDESSQSEEDRSDDSSSEEESRERHSEDSPESKESSEEKEAIPANSKEALPDDNNDDDDGKKEAEPVESSSKDSNDLAEDDAAKSSDESSKEETSPSHSEAPQSGANSASSDDNLEGSSNSSDSGESHHDAAVSETSAQEPHENSHEDESMLESSERKGENGSEILLEWPSTEDDKNADNLENVTEAADVEDDDQLEKPTAGLNDDDSHGHSDDEKTSSSPVAEAEEVNGHMGHETTTARSVESVPDEASDNPENPLTRSIDGEAPENTDSTNLTEKQTVPDLSVEPPNNSDSLNGSSTDASIDSDDDMGSTHNSSLNFEVGPHESSLFKEGEWTTHQNHMVPEMNTSTAKSSTSELHETEAKWRIEMASGASTEESNQTRHIHESTRGYKNRLLGSDVPRPVWPNESQSFLNNTFSVATKLLIEKLTKKGQNGSLYQDIEEEPDQNSTRYFQVSNRKQGRTLQGSAAAKEKEQVRALQFQPWEKNSGSMMAQAATTSLVLILTSFSVMHRI